MGIASNIKSLRTAHGMTQEEFGKIAGVSAMAVSQWENGRAVPRMGAVQRIADYFSISKGLVIDEVGQPLTAAAPIAPSSATVPLLTLGRVHAGELTDEEVPSHCVEVPASVYDGHPRAFALEVEGDCMNRVIPAGAHVLVDPDLEPCAGSIAVIETEDYRAVMRRWYRGSSKLMLSADSFGEYEDMIFGPDDGPVRVLGTVVWYQSSEEME